MNHREKIHALLKEVRSKFPPELSQAALLQRDAFHIELSYVKDGTCIDLGGGYSPVATVLAQLGMSVTVVDTFSSTSLYKTFDVAQMCKVLESYGVRLVTADLREYDLGKAFPPGTVDAVSSFDCLMFFHPRILLERVMVSLKTGGKLILSLNNATSLMKRFEVLTGISNVEPFHDYFYNGFQQKFWVKAELQEVARYLKLRNVRIIGRNWSAYQKWRIVPNWVLRASDSALSLFPSLCTSLYLIGRK